MNPDEAAFPSKVGGWHAEGLSKLEHMTLEMTKAVVTNVSWNKVSLANAGVTDDEGFAAAAYVGRKYAEAIIVELNKPTPEKL